MRQVTTLTRTHGQRRQPLSHARVAGAAGVVRGRCGAHGAKAPVRCLRRCLLLPLLLSLLLFIMMMVMVSVVARLR